MHRTRRAGHAAVTQDPRPPRAAAADTGAEGGQDTATAEAPQPRPTVAADKERASDQTRVPAGTAIDPSKGTGLQRLQRAPLKTSGRWQSPGHHCPSPSPSPPRTCTYTVSAHSCVFERRCVGVARTRTGRVNDLRGGAKAKVSRGARREWIRDRIGAKQARLSCRTAWQRVAAR